jgi:aspartate racemase
MKRIGIIGGMSPESTAAYYEYITRTYTERYGNYGYPEVLIYSVSFQDYVDWPNQNRWDLVAAGLGGAARKLELAGADFLVIATNTMHKVIDEIRAQVNVPVLSLLDVVAEEIKQQGLQTVGLLGTRFTMSQSFYREALAEKGLTVIVPELDDQFLVNKVIYEELTAGKILESSRESYVDIIDRLAAQGAEGIILGCTEIPLLLQQEMVDIPLFDTSIIHADAALKFALDN